MGQHLDAGFVRTLLSKVLTYGTIIAAAVFLYRLYQNRMIVRRAHRDYGVPILPHSFIFGHLPVIIKLQLKKKIPADLHGHWTFTLLREEYPEVAKCGVIYFDPWPIGFPMMAVLHPGMIAQYTVSPSLPKFFWMREAEFHPFSGGVDLVTSEGETWKEQRAIYNSGFSAKNMALMTPWFLEEGLVFKDRLLKAAESGETVKLEALTMDLTLDVIARATFDMRTRAQEGAEPAWLDDMRAQVKLLYFNLDPFKQLNPLLPLKHWRLNRRMKQAIEPMINDAYARYTKPDGPKTIVGLAVKKFAESGQPVPPDFMDKIVKNIKIFLFAGHETTSTTIAMTLFILSLNPDKLAALRAEHDAVLGPDPTRAAEVIQGDYSTLNKLTYTSAVAKEVLRMFPPLGGSIRESHSPDFLLTNPETGAQFPTYGLMMNGPSAALGRDEEYWHRPNEFLPERFLTRDVDDPLYPVKNAWLPFSLGPRACIGQEMVTLEIRLVLALVARELDIVSGYASDAPTFMGQAAYQVGLGDAVPSARIKDQLPVKIRRRVSHE